MASPPRKYDPVNRTMSRLTMIELNERSKAVETPLSGKPNFDARNQIFTFLSTNMKALKEDNRTILKQFEVLVTDRVKGAKEDFALLTALKSNGWTGSRFHASGVDPIDPNALCLTLSNLHLDSTASIRSYGDTVQLHINNSIIHDKKQTNSHMLANEFSALLGAAKNTQLLALTKEQVESFCPDCLIQHLAFRMQNNLKPLGVSSSSFTASSMLVGKFVIT